MATLPLTQGREAIIDDDDYLNCSKYKWIFNIKSRGAGYAQRGQHIRGAVGGRTSKTIYLHREILGITDSKLIVDHINGNTLDNRKINLRVVTPSISCRNRGSCRNKTSSYVGVHFHKLTKKWRAQIKVGSKKVSLGLFHTERDAALARTLYIEQNELDGFRKEG